jgi:hypothetical protein
MFFQKRLEKTKRHRFAALDPGSKSRLWLVPLAIRNSQALFSEPNTNRKFSVQSCHTLRRRGKTM